MVQYERIENGIRYTAEYTDETKYFGGFAWLIKTSRGGKRLYPATEAPERCVREWIEGKPPRMKRL